MRSRAMRRIAAVAALVCFCMLGLGTTSAFGQEPAPAAAEPATVTAPTFDRGDNAWMLTSAALVLFMTAPGLALFYGGLVRKKNVLGVMMQCVFLMGLMTVIWGTYGYSLAFSGTDKYIGNADYLFMKGVQRHYDAD